MERRESFTSTKYWSWVALRLGVGALIREPSTGPTFPLFFLRGAMCCSSPPDDPTHTQHHLSECVRRHIHRRILPQACGHTIKPRSDRPILSQTPSAWLHAKRAFIIQMAALLVATMGQQNGAFVRGWESQFFPSNPTAFYLFGCNQFNSTLLHIPEKKTRWCVKVSGSGNDALSFHQSNRKHLRCCIRSIDGVAQRWT